MSPKIPFELKITLPDGRPHAELHYEGGSGGTSHAVYTYPDEEARRIFEAIKSVVPPPVLDQYKVE